ncbi:hypothetical protein DSECCO2_524840 [anaerobic digester metagenome]
MHVPVRSRQIARVGGNGGVFANFKGGAEGGLIGMFQPDCVVGHFGAAVHSLYIEGHGTDESGCGTGSVHIGSGIKILLTLGLVEGTVRSGSTGGSVVTGTVTYFHYQKSGFHHVYCEVVGFVIGRVFVAGHHYFTVKLGFTNHGGGPG